MKNELKRMLVPMLVIALAVPTLAQPGKGQMKRGMEGGNLLESLDLTEEQESQIKDLRYAKEKKMINLQAKVKSENLDLRKLKRADDPNKKKIYAQIEKVSDARVAVQKARADHQLAMRKILTDEQYKIFSKGLRDREGRKGPREGKSARNKHRCRK